MPRQPPVRRNAQPTRPAAPRVGVRRAAPGAGAAFGGDLRFTGARGAGRGGALPFRGPPGTQPVPGDLFTQSGGFIGRALRGEPMFGSGAQGDLFTQSGGFIGRLLRGESLLGSGGAGQAPVSGVGARLAQTIGLRGGLGNALTRARLARRFGRAAYGGLGAGLTAARMQRLEQPLEAVLPLEEDIVPAFGAASEGGFPAYEGGYPYDFGGYGGGGGGGGSPFDTGNLPEWFLGLTNWRV